MPGKNVFESLEMFCLFFSPWCVPGWCKFLCQFCFVSLLNRGSSRRKLPVPLKHSLMFFSPTTTPFKRLSNLLDYSAKMLYPTDSPLTLHFFSPFINLSFTSLPLLGLGLSLRGHSARFTGWHREVHRTRGAEHLAELRAAELTQRVYGERPPWRAIVEESARVIRGGKQSRTLGARWLQQRDIKEIYPWVGHRSASARRNCVDVRMVERTLAP